MSEQPTSDEHVSITRTVEAPVALVWQMWTNPDHFASWYGPTGATIPAATMDVRVGGERLVCMEVATPAGPRRMWFAGEYREVVENSLLVYTESMANEHGEVLAPADLGMPADHPTTTVIRLELTPRGAQTDLTLTHSGIAPDSPGAAGWLMALDKLDAHLQRTLT